MERRDFLRKAGAAAAGAGALSACGEGGSPGAVATAEAAVQGPEVRWRMATSFPPILDILHGTAERMAERVSALTGGRFSIRVYAPPEIVPALQVMDGVQQGSIQAGYTGGYYYIGKSPALAFDSTVPFGLNARQQMAWLWHGGGNELLRDIYSDFGIVQFPAGNTGAQMGGWFREPVNTLEDLRGLRMRIPGIGGEIMQRLGVSVQVLGGPDIYPALERGAIDATEWVGPYDDQKLGFQQIAPNYYLPGWWEPGLSATLQINRQAWDRLPEAYQLLLESVSKEMCEDMLARYDVENPRALTSLVRDEGVTLRVFSDEILEAAWEESNAYLEEQAAGDATFRTVYDSWKAFRATSFPYFAGNELHYARFAFPRIQSELLVAR
ncbi:MAG: TRAP transporter substrate-binding protein DctP [Gemmatimonadota bacterium]|jgi:TRAP-type mannitol/chloroaromatic compound transport system substrate-binding protein